MMTTASTPHARPEDQHDKGYIPSLDGWRAIAVSLVIAAHCSGMLVNNGSRLALMAAQILSHAGYGVDIFFALSGFLITTLLLREKTKSGRIDLRAFYARRFFRILPPMACYLIVVIMLGISGYILSVGPIEISGSLLFFRNYTDGVWYTGHFWSLSIEEHFYAIVPVLVLTLRRKTLGIVSAALVVACICIRAYEFAHPGSFGANPQFRTENRVDALLWGSIIAQLCRDDRWRARLSTVLRPLVVSALVIGSAALLTYVEDPGFRRTLTAFVLPLLIVSTVVRASDLPSRILEWAPLRYVGRLSYSLYIWQMMFLGVSPRTMGPFQDFPLAIIAPLILAYLSYRFVEKPCIRFGHRLLKSAPRPPAYAS